MVSIVLGTGCKVEESYTNQEKVVKKTVCYVKFHTSAYS